MSYVLIVQQLDDKNKEGGEAGDGMAVYDFDADEGGEFDDDMDINDKSKIVKLMPKRSQQVSQAHMYVTTFIVLFVFIFTIILSSFCYFHNKSVLCLVFYYYHIKTVLLLFPQQNCLVFVIFTTKLCLFQV